MDGKKSSRHMYLVSSYLLTFLIVTSMLSSLSVMKLVIAQNNSRSDNEIFVCDFVQYCSNPEPMNTTKSPAAVNSQTDFIDDIETSINSTSPEVVSNISILVNSDLYNDHFN